GAGVVEQQVGEAVAAEVAGDDLRPGLAPPGVLLQEPGGAVGVDGVELADPGLGVVEQQVGDALVGEVAGHDLLPGLAPAGVLLQQPGGAVSVDGVEFADPGVGVVEQQAETAGDALVAAAPGSEEGREASGWTQLHW